jgi:predicted kinase
VNKKLIVVAGHLAAGKTTFALKLSEELHVPCFCKDLIKSTLGAHIPVNTRDDGNRLSAATFDAIAYIMERLMKASLPIIIEANFVMGKNHGGIKEGDVIRVLTEAYHYHTLTFLFTGKPRALYDRFITRESKTERGANRITGDFSLEEFERIAFALGCFDIGGKIEEIDTTEIEKVDFAHHIETARLFLGLEEHDFSLF